MLSIFRQSMGSICSKQKPAAEEDGEECQAEEIDRRIAQEARAEKDVQKLLLLGHYVIGMQCA